MSSSFLYELSSPIRPVYDSSFRIKYFTEKVRSDVVNLKLFGFVCYAEHVPTCNTIFCSLKTSSTLRFSVQGNWWFSPTHIVEK